MGNAASQRCRGIYHSDEDLMADDNPLRSDRSLSNEVRERVKDWVPTLAPSVFGAPEATLFGRRMPWSWLWRHDCLLPAVLAVAHRVACPGAPPLRVRPDERCVLCYQLDEDVYHQAVPATAALGLAMPLQHRLHAPASPDHGRVGVCMEFYPLLYALYPLLREQGLEPLVVANRVGRHLPEPFLWRQRTSRDQSGS